MKVLLVHSAYQQFGGEDSVVRAETESAPEPWGRGPALRAAQRRDQAVQRHAESPLSSPDDLFVENERRNRFCRSRVQAGRGVYSQHLSADFAFGLSHAARLGVPTVQVLHNFRPFCPNGLYYTQGQICEACRDGNYLNAVRKRCFKDSVALSGLYAMTLGLNRLAGMIDKISAFICLTEFFRIKMREVGSSGDRSCLCGRILCRASGEYGREDWRRHMRFSWAGCLRKRAAGR